MFDSVLVVLSWRIVWANGDENTDTDIRFCEYFFLVVKFSALLDTGKLFI